MDPKQCFYAIFVVQSLGAIVGMHASLCNLWAQSLGYNIRYAIFVMQSLLCNLWGFRIFLLLRRVVRVPAATGDNDDNNNRISFYDIHEKLHSEFEEKVACSVAMLCR